MGLFTIIIPQAQFNSKWLDEFIIKEVSLLDNNECSNVEDNSCHENAICTNTNGNFTCQCQSEYTGNGVTSNGKCQLYSIIHLVLHFH